MCRENLLHRSLTHPSNSSKTCQIITSIRLFRSTRSKVVIQILPLKWDPLRCKWFKWRTSRSSKNLQTSIRTYQNSKCAMLCALWAITILSQGNQILWRWTLGNFWVTSSNSLWRSSLPQLRGATMFWASLATARLPTLWLLPEWKTSIKFNPNNANTSMCTSSRQKLRQIPSSSSWNSAWIAKIMLPRKCSQAGSLKTRTASKFYHLCKLRRIIRTSMRVGEAIQDCCAIRVRDSCLKEVIMTITACSLKSHRMVCVETLHRRCPMGLQIKVWSTNRNSKEKWL